MKLNETSKYARVFDDSCMGWTRDQKINIMFLKHQENYFNDLLRKRGYVFLRDVYEGLGLKISSESCVVGWKFEEDNKIGDNYVHFMYDEDEDGPSVIIDFNVDGIIIDLKKWKDSVNAGSFTFCRIKNIPYYRNVDGNIIDRI